MAVFNVDADRAFECLQWVAEHCGTELPAVARRFVDEVEAMKPGAHHRDVLLGLLAELAEPLHGDAG